MYGLEPCEYPSHAAVAQRLGQGRIYFSRSNGLEGRHDRRVVVVQGTRRREETSTLLCGCDHLCVPHTAKQYPTTLAGAEAKSDRENLSQSYGGLRFGKICFSQKKHKLQQQEVQEQQQPLLELVSVKREERELSKATTRWSDGRAQTCRRSSASCLAAWRTPPPRHSRSLADHRSPPPVSRRPPCPTNTPNRKRAAISPLQQQLFEQAHRHFSSTRTRMLFSRRFHAPYERPRGVGRRALFVASLFVSYESSSPNTAGSWGRGG